MSERSTALVPLQAGNRPAAIVPTSFDECMQLARVLAQTNMAGPFKGKPEECCAAILHGLEVGLLPNQALASIAVINGRPSLYGDGALSVVQASGLLESFEETDDGTTATCRVKRRGNPHLIVRTFSVEDAKLASLTGKAGPWAQYPRRMRQMRARSWALRDGFSDVMRGLHLAEESHDVPAEPVDITPPPALVDIPDKPPATTPPPPVPALPDVPDDDPRQADDAFVGGLATVLSHCKTEAEVRKVADANRAEVEERGLEQAAQALVEKHLERVKPAPKPKAADGKTPEQVAAEQTYVRLMSGMRRAATMLELKTAWEADYEAASKLPDTWQKELEAEKDRLKKKLQA